MDASSGTEMTRCPQCWGLSLSGPGQLCPDCLRERREAEAEAEEAKAEHHREWLANMEPVFRVQREARSCAELLKLYVDLALRSGTEPARILSHLQLVRRAVLVPKGMKVVANG